MNILPASPQHLSALLALSLELWPSPEPDARRTELETLLRLEDCAFFLAMQGAEAVGFAQCQLRRDYVEGARTSPVAYLEGIYVRAPFRHQGIARALVAACENWSTARGCRELASDCELGNPVGIACHQAMRFQEVNRIVCFVKPLR